MVVHENIFLSTFKTLVFHKVGECLCFECCCSS